jgi:sugar (pentulose or hexulose) kinase
MKYLALDLGTSFLKGAVLELESASISHVARTPFPMNLPGLPPRHVEVDPAAIVQATSTLLEELLAFAPDAAGIVVTGQMDGVVLTDGAGKALSNAITWQDQRILDNTGKGVETYFDQLKERLPAPVISAIGNGLRPSLPLCTLAWWASQGMLPDGAVPASVCDFVLSAIGRSTPVCEPTMAASMGMFDFTTGDWHQGVLAELGLQRLKWPRIAPYRQPAYNLVIGGRKLPCYAPVGDHQCALVGALLESGELSLNISTGSQIAVIAPTFVPGRYEMRPFFDSGYLQVISRIPAGRALNALVGLLSELAQAEGYALRDAWATIGAAVDATPQTDMRVDVSFFANPVGERGEMTNLTEENLHIGHLFRAAFQSMAQNYAVCAGRLAPPQPWTRLVFSGGLAQRFGALRNEIAARFNLPYRMCPTSEDTLLGLLVLARVGAGMASTVATSVAQIKEQLVDTANSNG